MRKHKIDNARTFRHMYRNAHELRYYKYIMNRDGFVDSFDVDSYIRKELELKALEINRKLARQMKHKYRQFRDTDEKDIPLKTVIFNDYDISFDLQCWTVEVQLMMNGLDRREKKNHD